MKKKVVVASSKKVPKYFLGAVMAGVNVAGGIASAIKANNDAKKVAIEQEQNHLETTFDNDKLALENFETQGYAGVDYYREKGGRISNKTYMTKGGKLTPLSSDTEIATGNTHNSSKIDGTSGIKLMDGGSTPFAEIEDKETIKDGVKVFSDRIAPFGKQSYAALSAKLATAKGKAEEKLKMGGSLQASTAKREIAGIDKLEDALFQNQEESKVPSTTNVLAGGGLAAAMPFADNIVNTALTFFTPKTPKVYTQKAEQLNTKINVNPQLAEIQDTTASVADGIQNNTSNSNSARNQIASTRLAGMRATNEVMSKKENIETDLENRNSMNRQQVQASNLAKLEGRNQMDAARTSNILGKISANVSNSVDDFTKGEQYKDSQKFQAEQLNVIKQAYDPLVTARADLSNPNTIKAMLGDDAALQAEYARVKGTPTEKLFLAKYPNFKPF